MAQRLAAAFIVVLSIMASWVFAPDPALAQTPAPWPTRTVRFILPFGPGSGIDVGARLGAEKLAARWAQPVVIENRPGGDGILAMTSFLNANDDHVLLFVGVGSYTVHPYMLEKTPYDFKRDVLPVARIANTLMAVTLSSKDKETDLKSFMARARANPGMLNAAVPQGISEFVFDGFLKSEGLDIQKVPYKDVVQAMPDLRARACRSPAECADRRRTGRALVPARRPLGRLRPPENVAGPAPARRSGLCGGHEGPDRARPPDRQRPDARPRRRRRARSLPAGADRSGGCAGEAAGYEEEVTGFDRGAHRPSRARFARSTMAGGAALVEASFYNGHWTKF